MTDILKEYPLVDEHGKRYRIFGRGCREYAPKIVTSGGEFPVGAVTYRKPKLETIEQRKTCPFKGGMPKIALSMQTDAASERRRPASAVLSLRTIRAGTTA